MADRTSILGTPAHAKAGLKARTAAITPHIGALSPFVTMVAFPAGVRLTWDKTFISGTQPCSLSHRINVPFALTFGSLLSRALSRLGSRQSRFWDRYRLLILNMSMQYRLIRALRYATIALFLAAGLEGLKQVVFPNLSAGQSHIAAILICASVVFLLNLGLLRREKVQSEKVSENIIGNLPEITCIFDDAGNFRQWNSSCEGLRSYTASEEQYRSLVASVPDAVWKIDREGNLTFMSPQGENILGYSMAELYQQRASIWMNSIHIDDRQRVKQALEALFDDGRPFDVEFRAQRRNGEWFWAHDRAVAIHDKNGIRVATGLLSDITERKKAEEGLLRLASIVEFSEDAIIGKTTEGVITSWNRAAEEMYG